MLRRHLVAPHLVIVAVAAFLFSASIALLAPEVHVSPTGNDTTGDGTAARPYRTLQRAHTAVDTGGTIRVAPGRYPAAVRITKRVTITGDGAGVAVLGPVSGAATIVFVDGADDVVVRSVVVEGDGDDTGIRTTTTTERLLVDTVTVERCGAGGIVLFGSTTSAHRLVDVTVRQVRGASPGIALRSGSGATLTDVVVEDGEHGVEISDAPATTWNGGSVRDMTGHGIVALRSPNTVVANVHLLRCAVLPTPAAFVEPTMVGAFAILADCHGMQVRDVVVEDCGGFLGRDAFRTGAAVRTDGVPGFGLVDAFDVTVERTTFVRNRFGGAYVGGAHRNLRFVACNFVQNGDADGDAQDLALAHDGAAIDARGCWFGHPAGAAFDGAEPGNGVAGSAAVDVTGPAQRPYPSRGTAFRSWATAPAGARPRAIVVADWTGDGLGDYATCDDVAGTVTVHRNIGEAFAVASTTTIGGAPVAMAAGRFDGDPHLDLAVVDEAGDRVVVLFGDGAGGFPRSTSVVVPARPTRLRVANLDRLFRDDVVVACQGDLFRTGGVAVLTNDGTGRFTVATLVGAARPTDVETIDLDLDGFADVQAFALDAPVPGLRHWRNLGFGQFESVVTTPVDNEPVVDGTLVRCNVDGGPEDLAIASWQLLPPPGVTRVRLMLGKGDGRLEPPLLLHDELGPIVLRGGRLTGTNEEHLVVVHQGRRDVTVLGPIVADAPPFAVASERVFTGPLAVDAAVGDVSGDGVADLVVVDAATARVVALRSRRASRVLAYGTGCVGSVGVPVIRGIGTPDVEASTHAIGLHGARPLAGAFLFLGVTAVDLPLPGGCSVRNEALAIFATTTDANGAASLPMPIRRNVTLIGLELFVQWWVVDPGGAALDLLSGTSGLRVRIGG